MDYIFDLGPGHFLNVDFEPDDPGLVFNDRKNPWALRETQFVKLFRLSKDLAREVVNILEPRMPHVRRASEIPTDIKVLSAVRFFASGSYQLSVGQDWAIGLSQQSISNCLHHVLDAMEPIMANYIKFPSTRQSMNSIIEGFWETSRFPGTIGAIDCTHIAIVPPPRMDADYPQFAFVNRKKFYSINTQIICYSERQILSIWPRFPGRSHDSYIWRMSEVRQSLHHQYDEGRMEHTWLIGDSGYPLETVLMKPFTNVLPNSPQDRFNSRLSSARSSVECCIGILKNRWRCLLKERTLHYNPPTAAKIVQCCAVLHNLCIRDNVPLLYNAGEVEVIEEIPNEVFEHENYAAAAAVRNTIVQNFF